MHDQKKPRFRDGSSSDRGQQIDELTEGASFAEPPRHLGWGQLKSRTTTYKVCQSCAEAKAKQKAVPPSRKEKRSAIPNERIYHGLATVKAPSDVAEKVSKPVWQLSVDEATGLKFSTFHKTKDAILEDSSARLKALERLAGKEI